MILVIIKKPFIRRVINPIILSEILFCKIDLYPKSIPIPTEKAYTNPVTIFSGTILKLKTAKKVTITAAKE